MFEFVFIFDIIQLTKIVTENSCALHLPQLLAMQRTIIYIQNYIFFINKLNS